MCINMKIIGLVLFLTLTVSSHSFSGDKNLSSDDIYNLLNTRYSESEAAKFQCEYEESSDIWRCVMPESNCIDCNTYESIRDKHPPTLSNARAMDG
jgi:hypothetical protein